MFWQPYWKMPPSWISPIHGFWLNQKFCSWLYQKFCQLEQKGFNSQCTISRYLRYHGSVGRHIENRRHLGFSKSWILTGQYILFKTKAQSSQFEQNRSNSQCFIGRYQPYLGCFGGHIEKWSPCWIFKCPIGQNFIVTYKEYSCKVSYLYHKMKYVVINLFH